jgi:hypothetical protein
MVNEVCQRCLDTKDGCFQPILNPEGKVAFMDCKCGTCSNLSEMVKDYLP